jgi:transposase-like protein
VPSRARCAPGCAATPLPRRTGTASPPARWFFRRALGMATVPAEVTTDQAGLPAGLGRAGTPSALHVTERYANNRGEADDGQLKAWLDVARPLRRARYEPQQDE